MSGAHADAVPVIEPSGGPLGGLRVSCSHEGCGWLEGIYDEPTDARAAHRDHIREVTGR